MSTILSTQERETIIENLSNDPFYILPEYVTPNNLKLTKKEKEKISNSLKKRAKEKRQESRDSVNNRFHFYDVIKKIETQDIYEKVKKYVEEHYKLKQEDNLSREEGLKRLSEYFKVTSNEEKELTNRVKESFYNILEYCLIEIEPIIKTQKVFKNSVYEISKKHHDLFLEYNMFLDDLMTFDFWNECVNEAIDNFFNYPHLSQPHHDPAPEVDPVNTKADVLHPKLKEYGFFEIEKVKELNPEKQSKLVKLIANNSLPYQMAMLDFLNFIEHLKKNHFTTQTKTDQELSKILGTNERAVKGNRLVLNEISKEDKNRYTSHQYTDKVQSDYNNL